MSNPHIDLFRCSMSHEAGDAVKRLYTPDENGRIYCGEGPRTADFEREFALQTNLERVPLGTNSCTSAIDLALHLIGVGVDDEVICSAMDCTAGNGPVVTRGAKIVWADVDQFTALMNPDSVARVISKKTKAIIAVDWAGRHCDYKALKQFGIPVIEDAAHCFYLDREQGDYVCWSYGPIKFLCTGSYGGALLPPEEQYDRARLLRWHGLDRTGPSEAFRCAQSIIEVGYRYHMCDDQAVIGLANLALAKQNVMRARTNARWYSEALESVDGVALPTYNSTSNYWLQTALIRQDRDGFQERMAKLGIATGRAHARNDLHPAFIRATVRQDGNLPGTTWFDSHQTNIPVYSFSESDNDICRQRVVEAVIESVKN